MPHYVLFHGNCFDGFGAAWAAWLWLGDSAQYIPVSYGHEPPALPPDAIVTLVDFSYQRATLEALRSRVERLTVLDHHKTAQADLAGLDYCTFDMDKSGAMLAWEHFHPGVEPPRLIQYLQDRDLWRWSLPYSREISTVTAAEPFTFAAYGTLANRLEQAFESVVVEGRAIQRARDRMVETMVAQATWREIGGHRVPVANATILFSEVGEALCIKFPDAPFAAYYLDRADGQRQWGLRSRNGFDVSAVAKGLGGGGHAAAAGFVEPVP